MSAIRRARGAPRRVVSVTAVGALLVALVPASVAGAQTTEPRSIGFACQEPYDAEFEDVAEDNTHVEAILCAADHEIARGHTDGTYRPGDGVRRDQMASFIVRLIETAGGEELDEGDAEFDDVDEDNEHHDNIVKLAGIDVVEGYADDTYRPRQTVTRDQMASFIRRAIAYLDNEDARDGSAPPEADQAGFNDVGEDSPHRDAVDALAAQRVVVGDGEGAYQPRRDVRRDQMASFLMRGYDHAIDAGVVEPLGPSVLGVGTLFSDRIEVGFDDAVEVEDVVGFRVYSDEACTQQVAHGTTTPFDGLPVLDVELSDDLPAGEDHWFRLDARSVVDGDGYPNVASDCVEVLGAPLGFPGDDEDDSDDGDDGDDDVDGPQPVGVGAVGDDQVGVLFDGPVTVLDVEGFRVHSDDACADEVARGVEATGDGFFGVLVDLDEELTGDDGHWLRVEAGTVADGDDTPNEQSECIELDGA